MGDAGAPTASPGYAYKNYVMQFTYLLSAFGIFVVSFQWTELKRHTIRATIVVEWVPYCLVNSIIDKIQSSESDQPHGSTK